MKMLGWFGFQGRLSRGAFWLQSIAAWAIFYAVSAAVGADASAVVVWLANGVALVLIAMLCIRRLHDRDYSGWWLLAVLVPVAGALWLAWQMAVRRGVAQDNRWGAHAPRSSGDYLVVR